MKDANNTEHIDDKILADELEELRGRMSALRERLNSQQLVSDTLLRDVVKRSTEYSRSWFRLERFLMVPLAIVSLLYLHHNIGLPLWFVTLTCAMLAVSVSSDWRTQRLTKLDYGSTPLLEIQERFVLQKRKRARRMLAGMIMTAMWLALGVYVVADIPPTADGVGSVEYRTGMCVGAVIGGAIGLWAGLSAYFRMQRENEQAIRRMRDFMEK